MKNNTIKKITSVFLTSALIFSTISASSVNLIEAKGTSARPSAPRPSSKPSTSKPSSTNSSSKPSSSTASSKPRTSSTKNFTKNSGGSYNKDYNSYNNQGYKKQYTDYINNNYRSSGFFSGSSITNMLLWYTLFNSATSHNHIHASDQQKELVDNVKDSKVPVYMLEIKTKNGETKYVSVTKEQYEKVKEGDNISLKDGNLEIKN
ncbi:hypothetical protein [uncultured Gemella sp.]|uniref:hypothetical protein n=1 Tax=uncultured Gemella sp. TaxID=254352 RepID=UPI0028D184E1|nr:hypothetical protein [uncultured Gemella sp.]